MAINCLEFRSMDCWRLSLCICLILGHGMLCGGSGKTPTPDDNEYYYPHTPPVKVIETEDGDVVHCVEIHRQPALRNPASRKSFAEFKPPVLPKRLHKQNTSEIVQRWLKSGSCPEGTIPILARTKAGPVNYKNAIPKSSPRWRHSRSANKLNKSRAANDRHDGHEHATMELRDRSLLYNGAYGEFSAWNPTLESRNEMSLAQIWVTQGGDDDLRSVEAGWMVQPNLFGDSRTHFFAFYTPDGYHTICYNDECDPGFVQMDSNIGVGSVLTTSVVDGEEMEYAISIRRDESTGSWCLFMQDEIVGYWPLSLFPPSSFDFADFVSWGGEIGNLWIGGRHTRTQMGSGYFPSAEFGRIAFICGIGYYDENYAMQIPSLPDYRVSNANCYDLIDFGDIEIIGRTIGYGGPGYDSIRCP